MNWLRKKIMRKFKNWVSIMESDTKAVSHSLSNLNIVAIVSMSNKLYLNYQIPKTTISISFVI